MSQSQSDLVVKPLFYFQLFKTTYLFHKSFPVLTLSLPSGWKLVFSLLLLFCQILKFFFVFFSLLPLFFCLWCNAVVKLPTSSFRVYNQKQHLSLLSGYCVINIHLTRCCTHSFLARDVIYTSHSHAYAMMPVRLSVCLSVCDGSALAHYS